jgi:putative PIN family toxin of toxin-antitoxin system
VRVVVDTNVIVSALFFRGVPYALLDAWRDRRFILVTSPEILEEYRDVANRLSRKHKAVNIDRFIELVTVSSEIVEPAEMISQITKDPKDEKFLACAFGGNASVIVSGDDHLLSVNGYGGLRILKPRDFLRLYPS